MKLEILQENLNHGLSVVSKVLAAHPQISILSNVLLRTTEGQLELTASNMETTISVVIGAKIEESGSFTVPGKTFVEIINGLAAGKVSLEVLEGSMTVSSGKFKAKLNGSPADDFPKTPEIKKGSKWQIDSKTFQAAITKTIFCAALDEGRAVLTGVLFEANKKGLTLAATDGFRLSVVDLPIKGETDEVKFILPAKALFEASRLLTEPSFDLSFFSETNLVVFDLGDIKIYSRVIAGNYPDYEKIIPSISTTKIVVSSDELLKTIRLASVFARDSANIVKLKIKSGKLKISANAPQVGENESEMDVQVEKGEDEDVVVAFNYRYFLDLLNGVGSCDLSAEFNGPLAAGVFKIPSEKTFLHIIMPVRVQG